MLSKVSCIRETNPVMKGSIAGMKQRDQVLFFRSIFPDRATNFSSGNDPNPFVIEEYNVTRVEILRQLR